MKSECKNSKDGKHKRINYMRTKKRQVNLKELLKMIDFLPNSSEKPIYVASNIIYKDGEILPFSRTNYSAISYILNRCPEGGKIRKQARSEIEGIFDYVTYGTFDSDTGKEKVKLIKKLIRLVIIAF